MNRLDECLKLHHVKKRKYSVGLEYCPKSFSLFHFFNKWKSIKGALRPAQKHTWRRSDFTPHIVSRYVLIHIPFSLLCIPIQQCKMPCPISLLIFLLKSKTSDQSRSENTIGDMEEEVEMVGRAFVDHYYNLFDGNRSDLVSLYQSTSMLTFEGQKIQGVSDISAKQPLIKVGT